MDKIVRKSIEFGLGVAYITAGALSDALMQMEKKGAISPREGARLVRKTADQYRTQSVKYAKDVRVQINKMAKTAPFATRKEIKDLTAQVDKLLKQVEKTSKPKAKPKKRAKAKGKRRK